MEYYSNFAGPSKLGALEQIKRYYKASFLEQNQDFIENGKQEDLERLIDESITEGVNQIYGDSDECPGSATGWNVFVRPDILRETRIILGEKTRQYKRDVLEKPKSKKKKKVVSKQLVPQTINLDLDTNKGLADKINSMTKGGKRKRKTNKKHKQRKKKTKKRPSKKQKKTRKQKRYKN